MREFFLMEFFGNHESFGTLDNDTFVWNMPFEDVQDAIFKHDYGIVEFIDDEVVGISWKFFTLNIINGVTHTFAIEEGVASDTE
jgi:hypothetical protein